MVINYHDGGGNDPYRPDFTRVSVEPADLAEFADMLDSDIRALKETWGRMCEDLGIAASFDELVALEPSQLLALDPNFPGSNPADGTTGITEGAAFTNAYANTLFAKIQLMRDLLKGLRILRDAARDTHESYERTDAANADGVERPFAAYEPWQVIEAFNSQIYPQEASP